MKIDVVYLLGAGSTWGNQEIKYSVRSVQKNLKEFGDIFIVGQKPYYFNNKIVELPYKDVYRNKARCIMEKIYHAACSSKISANFMLFNDDYFLLQPFSVFGYPYYYKDTLQHAVDVNVGDYEKHCRATLELLLNSQKGTLNFDTHKPIVYNKKKFIDLYAKINHNVPFGYIAKSTYCNYYEIPGTFEQDCKISFPYTCQKLYELNANRQMFSTGEKAMNASMAKYLKELYPEKSKYEL